MFVSLLAFFLILILHPNLKVAAIIAEGHELGASSPVVYVSGEEVRVN